MAIEWTKTGGQKWTEIPPEAFGMSAAPEQTSLFGLTVELVKPPEGPQLDLFSGEEDQ